MTQSTQGIIIALLISLLIGVIIGFYLRQSRINDLSKALKQQKKRTEEVEQAHEKRLQDATLKLQNDYEQQLAEKIEVYQTQYDEQVSQLESEYDARLNMIDPAMAGVTPETLGTAVVGAGAAPDALAIEHRIRKQYETRLKEAAQKIQRAYEQHLKLKLNESRDALQQDYERRLAEKIEHYQDQLDAQLAQVSPMGDPMALSALSGSYPSGPAVSDTGVLSSSQRGQLETQLRQEYEQKLAEKIEHYQDDMAQRLEELEQEYESRMAMLRSATVEGMGSVSSVPTADQRAELERQLELQLEERFRAEYEQRLAEAIERYQDEMVQRTQELEQEYESRLQLVQQQMGAPAPLPDVEESATAFQVESTLFSDRWMADEPAAELDPSSSTVSPDDAVVSPDRDESSASAPAETPEGEDLGDLDDLLTLDQGENLVVEQPPMDDGGFELENLEDLLQEQENSDNSENLFDNLDDLSNLS